jgi:uncharacterized protein YbjT (DUF2867 family)
MSEKILVLGATGNVGRPLVQYLVEKGESVKAAIYPPELEESHAAPGVEAVPYDYYQSETHALALQGVNRIYMISKDTDIDPDKALNPFIDRAKAVGVKQIVLMTGMGVERASDKLGYRRLEKYVMASGMDYTILRPNWFMQIFKTPFILATIKRHGSISLPAGHGKLSFIDARDIAAMAAQALTEERHRGKEYTLTGGEALSFAEGAEIISKVTGRTIHYCESSIDDLQKVISEVGGYPGPLDQMERMFYTVREGWVATIDPSVREVLGREPITFEQFVRDNATVWQEL